MSENPVIGITAGSQAIAQPYADVIQRSGGTPWPITPGNGLSAEDFLPRVAGLVLTGEAGLDQKWHEADRSPIEGEEKGLGGVEMPALKAALASDMPVLGVCGGMHTLNMTLGGGAGQNISEHGSTQKDGEEVSSYHRVYITPGSKLAAIVGSGGIVRVNSRHRRGIKEAQKSRRLMASAYSLEDGIIEALESPEHDWVIAVQFEPQRRMEVPPHFDRLFQGLVERALR